MASQTLGNMKAVESILKELREKSSSFLLQVTLVIKYDISVRRTNIRLVCNKITGHFDLEVKNYKVYPFNSKSISSRNNIKKKKKNLTGRTT